jgi:hypothetical protein
MREHPHPERLRATPVVLALALGAAAMLGSPPPPTVAGPGFRTDTPDGTGEPPRLSIDDPVVTEGDEGLRGLVFRLTLSGPSTTPVTVRASTADSTATVAGQDFLPASPLVTFAPGSLAESLVVSVVGDTTLELDESARVRLAGAVGATLLDSVGVGTILNDDLPRISVSDTSLAEGNTGARMLAFRIQLAPTAPFPVTFRYQVVDRTATAADGDFIASSGEGRFEAGEAQLVLEVMVLGDSLLEANERFTLELSAVEDALPAQLAGIGTICNDERTTWEPFTPFVTAHPFGTVPPSFGDADGDGRQDLPLYLNGGPGFVEMPGFRSLLGTGNYHGSAWCDFDRDGDMDLVQMPYASTISPSNFTHLFVNMPGGFQEVAPSLGMDIVGHGETPAWGDFNADGWPDLFLPFYAHVEPFRSYLYVNLGNGQFEERADSAGVSLRGIPFHLRPEGTAVADWNGDGTLDLYTTHHLFVNDGEGRFTDVRAQVGLPALFDEGANFVDHDNDGDLDLYLRTAAGPTLFENRNGMFVDATATLGLGPMGWGWGDRWADLDNDGDQDLLFIGPGAEPRLLLNRGDGTFIEDASFAGLLGTRSLAAFADIDGDGDLDIAIGDYGREFARNLLERVPRTGTPQLRVRVEDEDGLLTAHGSTVRLRSLDDPAHPVQSRIVDGGSGYLGQDEYTVTFGGVGSGAFDLEVSYPSRPGSPRVAGPLQNPLLSGLRPGVAEPQLVIVRPGGEASTQSMARAASAAPATAGVSFGTLGSAALRPAVPNPARAATRFEFTLPAAGAATLEILDLSGRRVRLLIRERAQAGTTSASWDLRDDAGRPVPAGLYFARLLRHGRVASTQRVAVVR